MNEIKYWTKMNKEKKWISHENSNKYLISINIFCNLSTSNIGIYLQDRGNMCLTLCQENNRHFFVNGLIPACKILVKKAIVCHGDVTGERGYL